MKHIVKRKGHKEPFDEKKLYASIYAACMTLRVEDEEAETIAQMVCDEVISEIKNTQEVTAEKLQNAAAKSLKKYHPDTAYMYKTHLDVS